MEPDDFLYTFTEELMKESHDLTALGESKTQEQQERLSLLTEKLSKLADSRQNRRETLRWLEKRLGYSACKVQDLNQLSFEEKGLICQLTWQSWENLLWAL